GGRRGANERHAPHLAATLGDVVERAVGPEDDVARRPGAGHDRVRRPDDAVARPVDDGVVDVAAGAVAEEVVAVERAERGAREPAADDARAERRDPALAGAGSAVRVVEDRVDVAGLLAARREDRLAVRPGVVAAGGHDVDLLEREVADVGEPELAGVRVEAEAERVPEARREDLLTLPGLAEERVVVRDRAVEVEPHDLALDRVQVLRVRIRRGARAPHVVAVPRVADPSVELAVGPDPEDAAVVVAAVGPRAGVEERRRRRADARTGL